MVSKKSLLTLIGSFFKLSIVMLLLIVIGCADDKTKVISVPTVTRVPTEITSLNFSEGVTSGSVELTVTASTAIGADVDTKTTEGENDFSTTAQKLESVIGISGYATQEVDPQDWYSISVVSGQAIRLDINTTTPENDLDLLLYKDFGNGPELVDGSFSITNLETVPIRETGEYLVQVDTFSGEAAYLLSIEDSESESPATGNALRLSVLSSTNCEGSLCSRALSGQWVMTTSTVFDEEMKNASAAEVSAAQENIVSSVGMTVTGGAGSMLLKTGLQDNSADSWKNMAKRLGLNPTPWSENEGTQIVFAAGDANLNGVADQQELLLTILIAKKVSKDDSMSQIKSAGLNYIRNSSALPNDDAALVSQQFASHYSLIRLEQAWDSGINNARGREEVLVAVLDTGIVPLTGPEAHPDWANVDDDASDSVGKLRYGFDFVSSADIDGDQTPGIDSDPTDIGPASNTSFHGTHVAGTIAAPTNNQIGLVGVGRDVSIMAIRVLGNCGCGSTFDILQGNLYAAGLANESGIIPAEKADIINMSLGGGGFNQTAQDVYNQVRAQGVIIIAAAGNESTGQLGYPASYEGIVSVSASSHGQGGTPSDIILAEYSNFGSEIDVTAPGGRSFADENGDGLNDGVLSTVGLTLDPSGYSSFNGTSMAAPHVAGVAALMESVHVGLTPDEFDQTLLDRTIVLDVGAPGRDDSFGAGLIDTLNAVRVAESLAGISPTPQPDEPPLEPANPVGRISAQPSSLNFGAGLVSRELRLRNSGDEEASVIVQTLFPSSDSLIVSETEVDISKLGTYVVTLDRSELPEGANEFTIDVETNVGSLSIPVSLTKPEPAGPIDAGPLHLILLDASSLKQQNCALLSPTDGIYSTKFESVPNGDYFALAGSDTNGDGLICGPFEACGAYKSLGDLQQITETNVDFTINYSIFDLFPSGQFRGCN